MKLRVDLPNTWKRVTAGSIPGEYTHRVLRANGAALRAAAAEGLVGCLQSSAVSKDVDASGNNVFCIALGLFKMLEGKTGAGVKRYAKGVTLGEGTYGVVFKALDTQTNRTVAVKKIRLGKYKEGVHVTALREIKLLKELHDPNIIELVDVYPHKRNLHLVFEFMESDLEAVIRDRNIVLSSADIKSYMQMCFKGLAHCHRKWVLHRDLKPNNLLIASDGQLKLADFGLARIFGSPDRKFTHQVFARWYRSPELLFGSKQYGSGVDIWAAGCIFAELLLRKPFLQGSSDIDQLGKIFAAFGTPKESQWADMTSLPDYVEFQFCPAPPLRSLFPMASEDTLDLLSKMFAFDPKARISAQQALEHRYFLTEPAPTKPHLLSRPPPRAEGVGKPPELASPKGPIVLSPPAKARRISLFPGVTGGEHVHHSKESREPSSGGTLGETPSDQSGMAMSVDMRMTASFSMPLRPTLSSTDRSYLKRKLDMDLAVSHFQEERQI